MVINRIALRTLASRETRAKTAFRRRKGEVFDRREVPELDAMGKLIHTVKTTPDARVRRYPLEHPPVD